MRTFALLLVSLVVASCNLRAGPSDSAARDVAAGGGADPAFHHHPFAAGESFTYRYEDTDTTFGVTLPEGLVQADQAFRVQELQIPVTILLQGAAGALTRTLTMAPDAQYRAGPQATLGTAAFATVASLIPGFPSPLSYAYKDEAYAMKNFKSIFPVLTQNDVSTMLFYKTQDIHQMLDSTELIPEGITPGQVHLTPGSTLPGLGGVFVAAAEQSIYTGVETFNGQRVGSFKAMALGNHFTPTTAAGSTDPLFDTFTNFTYTLHVALDGAQRGLLLYGDGQETATVLQSTPGGTQSQPVAVLQRQFSIRLQ